MGIYKVSVKWVQGCREFPEEALLEIVEKYWLLHLWGNVRNAAINKAQRIEKGLLSMDNPRLNHYNAMTAWVEYNLWDDLKCKWKYWSFGL